MFRLCSDPIQLASAAKRFEISDSIKQATSGEKLSLGLNTRSTQTGLYSHRKWLET